MEYLHLASGPMAGSDQVFLPRIGFAVETHRKIIDHKQTPALDTHKQQ